MSERHSHNICTGCVDSHRVLQSVGSVAWKGWFADEGAYIWDWGVGLGEVNELVERQLVRRTRIVPPFVIGIQNFLPCLFAWLEQGYDEHEHAHDSHRASHQRIDQGLQKAIVIVNRSRQGCMEMRRVLPRLCVDITKSPLPNWTSQKFSSYSAWQIEMFLVLKALLVLRAGRLDYKMSRNLPRW